MKKIACLLAVLTAMIFVSESKATDRQFIIVDNRPAFLNASFGGLNIAVGRQPILFVENPNPVFLVRQPVIGRPQFILLDRRPQFFTPRPVRAIRFN